MINSLEPGDPLPGQPPGPFGSSEVMTVKDLEDSAAGPFRQCIRDNYWPKPPVPHIPMLGWAQAGKHYFPPF